MTHMIGSNIEFGVVDKRRAISVKADSSSHLTTGPTVFTANAGGTTTTIVGANAAPGTNTNVIREGDRFRLFNSAGTLKEETVFEITDITVAGSTTVTFTPAAAGDTANGDFIRLVGAREFNDIKGLDDRLKALNGSFYTDDKLRSMTVNDKIFAIRQLSDSSGI